MANPNETVNIGIEIDVDKAQKDLDTLNKTIQTLNASTDDTEDLVKELEKQWDRLDAAIKDAGEGQKNLNKELKAVTKQLQIMKLNGQENTAEYQKLIARAGALKDAMSDTSQAIRNAASDTSNLDAILSGASAASGGFGLVTSAMSMFGAESENVEKAQKKLMQAISLVNSVQALSKALNKDSAFMQKINAAASKLLSKQMDATAVSTNKASSAMSKFKASLISTGVGALVVALGALVAYLTTLADKEEEAAEAASKFNEELLKQQETIAKTREEQKKLSDEVVSIAQSEEITKADEKKAKSLKKLNEERAKSLINEETFLEKSININRQYSNDLKQAFEDRMEIYKQTYRLSSDVSGEQARERIYAVLTAAEKNYQGELEKREELEKKRKAFYDNAALNNRELSEYELKQVEQLNAEIEKQNTNVESTSKVYQTVKSDLDGINSILSKQISALNEVQQSETNLYVYRINKAKEYLSILQDLNKATETEISDLSMKLLELEVDSTSGDPIKNAQAKTALLLAQIKKETDAEIKKNKDIEDKNEEARNNAIENAKKLGQETTDIDNYYNTIKEENAKRHALTMQAIEKEQANEIAAINDELNRLIEKSNEEVKERREADLYDWLDVASTIGDIIENIGEIQDDGSKKAFETQKRTQIASALVTGAAGAAGAFAQAAGSIAPPAGEIIGATNAAAVVASTAARIAAIKRQKWNNPNEGNLGSSSGVSSSPSLQTGTSNVNQAIISRNITDVQTPKVEYVAIVDEITYKQKQQTNIQKVSVI